MLGKFQALGKVARVIYATFTVLIIVPLIILWGKASLVGMIAVACIVFLPLLAVWIGLHKRSRNMHRPMARPKS